MTFNKNNIKAEINCSMTRINNMILYLSMMTLKQPKKGNSKEDICIYIFVHFLFYMNKNYPAMKTTTLYKDNVTYIKFMHFYPITTIIICCSKSSLFYSFSLILFFILFKLCFIFVLVVSIYACFESNAGCYLCLIQLVH